MVLSDKLLMQFSPNSSPFKRIQQKKSPYQTYWFDSNSFGADKGTCSVALTGASTTPWRLSRRGSKRWVTTFCRQLKRDSPTCKLPMPTRSNPTTTYTKQKAMIGKSTIAFCWRRRWDSNPCAENSATAFRVRLVVTTSILLRSIVLYTFILLIANKCNIKNHYN